MKKLIIIFLIPVFLLPSLSKTIIIFNYEFNKKFIAEYLCENKSKPQMHCNGKCHLQKQINEDEKKQNVPAQNIKNKYENIFFNELENFGVGLFARAGIIYPHYVFQKYKSSFFSVFHPPKLES